MYLEASEPSLPCILRSTDRGVELLNGDTGFSFYFDRPPSCMLGVFGLIDMLGSNSQTSTVRIRGSRRSRDTDWDGRMSGGERLRPPVVARRYVLLDESVRGRVL